MLHNVMGITPAPDIKNFFNHSGRPVPALEPGDVIFFHGNLLHASDRNNSENPRWSMICCYNFKGNNPYKESHHPRYTPLVKVADEMIKKVGIKRFADDTSNVAWLEQNRDASATALRKAGVAK